MRLSRVTAVAGAATALLLGAPAAALAVGTGGVDLSPLPAVSAAGTPVTSFHVALPAGGGVDERFALRNLTGRPALIDLYAAAVDRGSGGGYVVGRPGSAPWVSLPRQEVTLAPHAVRTFTFLVRRALAPRGTGTVYAAVVLQHQFGTLVERTATLVYLDRVGPDLVGRALLPVVLAAALVTVVGALTWWSRRRRPGPGPLVPVAAAPVRQLVL